MARSPYMGCGWVRRSTAGKGAILLVVGAIAPAVGCATSTSHLELVTPKPGLVGLKLLRPDVSRRRCASSWFGAGPDGVPIDAVLSELLALDEEAQVVTNAEVRWETVVTAIYNRRCVEVRGDLARPAATMRLPASPGEHPHH